MDHDSNTQSEFATDRIAGTILITLASMGGLRCLLLYGHYGSLFSLTTHIGIIELIYFVSGVVGGVWMRKSLANGFVIVLAVGVLGALFQSHFSMLAAVLFMSFPIYSAARLLGNIGPSPIKGVGIPVPLMHRVLANGSSVQRSQPEPQPSIRREGRHITRNIRTEFEAIVRTTTESLRKFMSAVDWSSPKVRIAGVLAAVPLVFVPALAMRSAANERAKTHAVQIEASHKDEGYKAEIARLKTEIEQANSAITRLQADIAKAQADTIKAQADADAERAKIAAMERSNAPIDTRILSPSAPAPTSGGPITAQPPSAPPPGGPSLVELRRQRIQSSINTLEAELPSIDVRDAENRRWNEEQLQQLKTTYHEALQNISELRAEGKYGQAAIATAGASLVSSQINSRDWMRPVDAAYKIRSELARKKNELLTIR